MLPRWYRQLTRSLREPGGTCTKSMEVSESRMERVKSQKGCPLCSVENQKGAFFHWTKSMVLAPFWFSTEHCWTLLTPFCLLADMITTVLHIDLLSITSQNSNGAYSKAH